MRKLFILPILLLVLPVAAPAQSSGSIKKDSLYIDSLQKLLPSLRDTARINCLNHIAEGFLNKDDYKLKRKSDSAFVYALRANEEAIRTGYKYGIAQSLIQFSGCSNFYSFDNRNNKRNNSANVSKWEGYQKQLFDLAPQVNDPNLWGMVYYCQSNLVGWKNSKQEEIEANKNALAWFKKAGNEMREGEVCTYLGYNYSNKGDYENAFDYFSRALEIGKKLNKNADPDDFSNTLVDVGFMNIASMYSAGGDYQTALDYLHEYQQLLFHRNLSNGSGLQIEMTDNFLLARQYDSAFHYLTELRNVKMSAPVFLWPRIGDAFLLQGNKDSALFYFNKAIDSLRKEGQFWPVVQSALMRSYLGKAKILAAKNDPRQALDLVKRSNFFAEQRENKLAILNSYELQAQLFHQLRKNDSAYFYLRKFITIKDSMLTKQFLWRLNTNKKEAEEEKKTSQINLLNKDNQLKEQKLKQQATVRNSLTGGIILLLLLAMFVFRNLSLKRKKERAELQGKATELESQALRAQMNPHFIFNCLSSINKFILNNDTDAASDYLTRFSRLIRLGLINSQLSSIPLSDEIEMLRLYLDMERLRFNNSFDYNIIYENTIEPETIYIPPLLLQPFCENAIWHGLMHKEEQGKLDVIMSNKEDHLQCIITDNGIGRKKSEELKSSSTARQKPFGLKITTERLALFNDEKMINSFYKAEDLFDRVGNVAGTKVTLNIKLKDAVKEQIKETI